MAENYWGYECIKTGDVYEWSVRNLPELFYLYEEYAWSMQSGANSVPVIKYYMGYTHRNVNKMFGVKEHQGAGDISIFMAVEKIAVNFSGLKPSDGSYIKVKPLGALSDPDNKLKYIEVSDLLLSDKSDVDNYFVPLYEFRIMDAWSANIVSRIRTMCDGTLDVFDPYAYLEENHGFDGSHGSKKLITWNPIKPFS